MKENVAVQCSWLGDRQHSTEEPWESQVGEEARGVEGQSGQEAVMREQREKRQNGDKRFEGEGGAEVLH